MFFLFAQSLVVQILNWRVASSVESIVCSASSLQAALDAGSKAQALRTALMPAQEGDASSVEAALVYRDAVFEDTSTVLSYFESLDENPEVAVTLEERIRASQVEFTAVANASNEDALIEHAFYLDEEILQLTEVLNAIGLMLQNDLAANIEAQQVVHNQPLYGGILVTSLAIIILGILGFFFSRRFAKPLKGVTARLDKSTENTLQASETVQASSSLLASSASRHADSVRQNIDGLMSISAALGENASSAEATSKIARKTRETAESGAVDMDDLARTMSGIKEASDGIGQIMKTIEEIAFQTNILALNAAVEAARAGEAGAGFAIVADEVRGLAQRCSSAASETESKIMDARNKSEQGVAASKKVADNLQEMLGMMVTVDQHVHYIAGSSQTQTESLKRMVGDVEQMGAEMKENAKLADGLDQTGVSLKAQVDELKTVVANLETLVSKKKPLAKSGSHTSIASQAPNRMQEVAMLS